NRLIVSDLGGNASKSNIVVTSGSITGFAPATIYYSATGDFSNSGSNDGILLQSSSTQAATFNVQGTLGGSTTMIQTGQANDTFNVSSNAPSNTGNLAGVEGTLTLVGGTGSANRLVVSDLGSTAAKGNIVVTNNA